MEPMYVAREIRRNILIRVDFSMICDVIKSFPKLKQNIEKECNTLPLS